MQHGTRKGQPMFGNPCILEKFAAALRAGA